MSKEIKLPKLNETWKMRGPKVRDMRVVEQYKTPAEKELYLIANLTEKTMDQIEDLEMKDYNALSEGLADFLS